MWSVVTKTSQTITTNEYSPESLWKLILCIYNCTFNSIRGHGVLVSGELFHWWLNQPLLLERAVSVWQLKSFIAQQLQARRGVDSHLRGGWGQLPKLEPGQEAGLGCLAVTSVQCLSLHLKSSSPSSFVLILWILTIFENLLKYQWSKNRTQCKRRDFFFFSLSH